MQVTQEDLRRSCAAPHEAFARCAAGHEPAERQTACATERIELEQCAQKTVAMVRTINAECGSLYSAYEDCCKRAGASRNGSIAECEPSAQKFWKCAERVAPEPLM